MTLPKAIELLQQDLDDPGSIDISDLNQAQELGIEAMKEIHRERIGKIPFIGEQLRGETKD